MKKNIWYFKLSTEKCFLNFLSKPKTFSKENFSFKDQRKNFNSIWGRRRIPTLAGITPFLSLFLFISFLSSFHSLSFSRSISFTLSLSLSLFRSIPISFTLFSPSISPSFSLLISFPLFSPSLFLSHCLSWSSFELTILIWNQF